MRCAIYYIPPLGDFLCAAAAAWLRRDPYTGASVSSEVEGLDAQTHALVTAAPRRYGFHATIKAPFRLADGRSIDELGDRLGDLVAPVIPFSLELEIRRMNAFFAFTPMRPVPELNDLAARVVAELDHFRAPISEADTGRRNLTDLNERQFSHLISWGYPYVFDQFRFHMTLSGPVAAEEAPAVEAALRAHFGSATHRVEISQLVVAIEPAENAPFCVYSVHPLAPARTPDRQRPRHALA